MQAHELRAIAVEAHVDPRTVAKILKGETVRGAAGARALSAIARHLASSVSASSNPSAPFPHTADAPAKTYEPPKTGTEQAIES